MKVLVNIILLLQIPFVYGYVPNRGDEGQVLKWPDGVTNLSLLVDESDRPSTSLALMAAISDSLGQWNPQIGLSLSASSSTSQEDNQNDVYFSDHNMIFGGGGVLGATVISYNRESGTIGEGDILISTDFFDTMATLMTRTELNNLLKDVINHEVGHFIGLSHSEVKGATMFYGQFDGQRTLYHDDKAGGYALYPFGAVRGTISGKIIGGPKRIPVFGTYVQAISESKGVVMAAGLSEKNGSFVIEGLPLNDTYYLFNGPLKRKSAFGRYYADVKKDFCSARADYRGSFFQACSTSHRGFPQGIALSGTTTSVNTGEMTIRCGFDAPSDYLTAKGSGTFTPPSQDSSGNVGNTFVGFFTRSQFEDEDEDRLSISLGSYTPDTNDFLEIKVIGQGLYSILDTETNFDSSCTSTPADYKCSSPDSEEATLDKIIRVRLSPSDTSIAFNLTPANYSSHINGSGACKNNADYPSCRSFGDPLHFYLLTFRIVEEESNGSYTSVSQKVFPAITSNSSCPDASGTYSINSKNSEHKSYVEKSEDSGGCGSIQTQGNGGPPSAQGSLAVGLLLGVALLSLKKTFFGQSSRYS